MAEIIHLLTIDAPAASVYRAITEQTGLAGWWTEDCKAEAVVGSIAVFDFADRYHNEMTIRHLEPNRRVEWECLVGDPEWIGTVFIFDLTAEGNQTTLRFTHGKWRQATDFMAHCNYNWGLYMKSLKDYCETGKGTPFPGS